MLERPVKLQGQITIPVKSLEELEFARYNSCSVVCHEGEDAKGHYITYKVCDERLIRISDLDIRLASHEDLDTIERWSTPLMFTYDSASDQGGCESIFVDAILDRLAEPERDIEQLEAPDHPKSSDAEYQVRTRDDSSEEEGSETEEGAKPLYVGLPHQYP